MITRLHPQPTVLIDQRKRISFFFSFSGLQFWFLFEEEKLPKPNLGSEKILDKRKIDSFQIEIANEPEIYNCVRARAHVCV